MKASWDSLKLFKKFDYRTVILKQGENLLTVRPIYTGSITDNYASSRGHYSEQNFKTTINTVGILLTNEYGITDDQSISLGLGYSKSFTKFKGSSSIKVDNLYADLFMKTNFGNLKFA